MASKEYTTISLKDLILEAESQETGQDKLQNILSSFYCEKNPDVESFLRSKNKAVHNEKNDISRTYLVFDFEKTDIPIAYYSLAISMIDFAGVDTAKKKRILNFTHGVKSYAPAILIGQLGKNSSSEAKGLITGTELMNLIFRRVQEMYERCPAVLVRVDCQNNKFLKEFYGHFGFQEFKKTGSPNEGLISMVMKTSKIIDFIKVESDI